MGITRAAAIVSLHCQQLATNAQEWHQSDTPEAETARYLSDAKWCSMCSKEDVQLDQDAFSLLAQVSAGDLRKAVTTLQSAVRLGGTKVSR